MNPRGVQLTKIALGLGVLGLFAGIVLAEEPVTGLEDWEFLLGDWQIVAKRYSFESELIEQTDGQATFSHTMNGRRIQELQSTIHAGQRSEALVILVYSPRAEQIEIVDRLLASTTGALLLLWSVDQRELPAATMSLTIKRAARHTNVSVRDLFEHTYGRVLVVAALDVAEIDG